MTVIRKIKQGSSTYIVGSERDGEIVRTTRPFNAVMSMTRQVLHLPG